MAKKTSTQSAKAGRRGNKTAARSSDQGSASRLIDARITELDDWRGRTLARIRTLIRQADPDVIEDVKWRNPSNPMGVPVWSHPRTSGGSDIICTGETYKDKVKLTFAKGAALDDAAGLFNASLEGATRRAIDLHEGDKINEKAFKSLIRAAAALSASPAASPRPRLSKTKPKGTVSKGKRATETTSNGPAAAAKPKLLSGGNPQIAKADGDAPVQAYIAAMPGWKRDVGRRLDAIIVRALPGVRKAVKWNSPLYGAKAPGSGWFLSFHCFTKYVKVAFFRGTSLRPVPPGKSKQKEVRYLDIHENDQLDEARFAAWVKQASQLPGEHM